jgi:DNA-binding MarR family transcriptional regulator
MDQGLVERGLTRARAGVIWLLHQRGALTQRALSEALGVTPRNVTGLVDALQADGFVTREAHPKDRRATLVTLTRRGSAAGAKMQGEYRELAKRLFDDISGADLSSFVAILEQVLGRFQERESDSPNASA